ncbi:hypothetical protein [Haloferax profundi]|uniref:Uncharacterized protein n=1 Tax=Haloferax profundi TaxID=1544718 RepID=A0A0W1SRT6_9EURY|nr:hypothetical protein [Haloferax profundi]KTG29017.1 hypothetical protein AUR66_11300 [Haloferax profundi]
MSGQRDRFGGSMDVLYGKADLVPLPDEEAERLFYQNMMTVADAQELKADMLADPETTVFEAHERQLEGIATSYERRCRQLAGDDYEETAMAYQRGERDDHVGALTAYYFEGLWRMQQYATITDTMFFPIILRYPNCVTVNIRFASGHTTTKSLVYESPEHSTEELDDEYAERYYNEGLYSQKQAAKAIRECAQIVREQFPDPDEVPFEERKYGGIVSAIGRRGPVFSTMLESVEPDPDRFSGPPAHPMLVDEGPEAKQTTRELLPEESFVV